MQVIDFNNKSLVQNQRSDSIIRCAINISYLSDQIKKAPRIFAGSSVGFYK